LTYTLQKMSKLRKIPRHSTLFLHINWQDIYKTGTADLLFRNPGSATGSGRGHAAQNVQSMEGFFGRREWRFCGD